MTVHLGLREGSGGSYPCVYPDECSRVDEARLFPVVPSPRARANEHKLKDRKTRDWRAEVNCVSGLYSVLNSGQGMYSEF